MYYIYVIQIKDVYIYSQYSHFVSLICMCYVDYFTCLDYYYRVTTLYVKTSDPDESKFSCTVENCVILLFILPSN